MAGTSMAPLGAPMADVGDSNVSELLRRRVRLDAELSHYQQAVAVLFVDLVGSTRFYEQHGDVAGLVMVQKFLDKIVPIIEKHEGEVVKTIGDAILARFQTAFHGVCCALNMQWSLLQHNSGRPRDEQIHIRVALNYGVALIKDRDVFGDVVNVCSRIESAAQPDDILISPSVYDQICQHEEFAIRKRAEGVQLKGKTEKLDLYEVVWRFGTPVEPLPPRPSESQVAMAALPEPHAVQEASAAVPPPPPPSDSPASAAIQPPCPSDAQVSASVEPAPPRPSDSQVSAAVQQPAELAVPSRKPWPQIALFGGVVAVLVLTLAVALWRGTEEKVSTPAAAEADTASIAVLPFMDLSPEKNQEYFSDGLAEELLNDLTKIPGLRVTARTSSFQFKGKTEDLRVIGAKLNVGAILEGSVRTQGRRVRITVQLIKTSDGFHLWSETYERQLNDIFGVQEEIARSVAGSLKRTLLGAKIPSSRATNAEAYAAYLQGRYFQRLSSKDGTERAVRNYEQAIKLDPGYAPAWAALASARAFQAGAGYIPLHEGFQQARKETERALALDPNLAEAHTASGYIKEVYDWDWVGANASCQRALELEPGNASVIGSAAEIAGTLGRWDEALRLARQRVELDPLDAWAHGQLAWMDRYTGRLDEAEAELRKALELNPQAGFLHTNLTWVYLAKSRPQLALAEAERDEQPLFHLQGLALAYHALGRVQDSDRTLAQMIEKNHADGAFQIAEVYAFRGDIDRAFEWLERAYLQRDGGFYMMKGDLLLKNLEPDPRYSAFLKKMRLPLD